MRILSFLKRAAILNFAVSISLFASDKAWTELSEFRLNKEAPHAFFIVSEEKSDADLSMDIDKVDNIYAGSRYQSLNGKWKFFYAETPEAVKDEFFSQNFDASKWDEIKVPSTWEMHGYGKISYPNTTLEMFFNRDGGWLKDFDGIHSDNPPALVKKPYVPEMHRQSAVYRTKFTPSAKWKDKQIFLRFDGVKSGFRLFVNGHYVGYSEDSFTPAEFDITKFLNEGENTVALQVYKFTTGSFFEVQDMPHTHGIFRDVTAIARSKVYVEDYYAPVKLSDDFQTAEIDLNVKIQNKSDKKRKIEIEYSIVDKDGKSPNHPVDAGMGFIEIDAASSGYYSNKFTLKNFKLWSPDKPHLYKIVIRLVEGPFFAEARSGPVEVPEIETIAADFAFRKFEIRGKEILLNGKRFLIKGVNRHDYSPTEGSAVDFALLKKDLLLIKNANINSIRTSHYPNPDKFYMLCNRLGIAVLDENNHETHDLRKHIPAENDIYIAPSVDRMTNLVMRDRNIPSVLMFSLGNESATYYSKTHRAMEQAARKLDPTRPIHSEPGFNEKETNGSDFVSPMYGYMSKMQWYLKENFTKPFFFCEYAFVHGLGIGDLKGMWDIIRAEPSLNGGYIWDWADRTLWQTNSEGVKFLADGRDFGTRPDDGTWCASGLVLGDRTFTPDYFEVKKVYEDIQIAEAGLNSVKITNEFFDTNLNEFDAKLIIVRNGVEIASKNLPAIDLPAGQSTELLMNYPAYDDKKAGEYFYVLRFLRKTATPYADAGSTVYERQFFLRSVDAAFSLAYNVGVAISKDKNTVTVRSGDSKYVFDSDKAELVSYEAKGNQIISSPVKFDILSAFPHNQGQFESALKNFGAYNFKEIKKDFSCENISPNFVRVNLSKYYVNEDGDGFLTELSYVICSDKALYVNALISKINDTPSELLIPRIGLKWGVDKKLSEIQYYGRGPLVNFADELQAADVGLYKIDLAQSVIPYSKPQDTGNREDVRWMALKSGKNSGVLISSNGSKLPMSIMSHTQEEISMAKHFFNLPSEFSPEFRIAYRVAGIGNGSLDELTQKRFRIDFEGSVEFNFILIPFDKNADISKLINVHIPPFRKHSGSSENIKVESLKNMPEGDWMTDNVSVSYSSTEPMYAPKNDTLLECKGENFAFHTKRDEDRQYLIVDLNRQRKVTGALIYNRKDAQGDRTDRLRMYLSGDKKNWTKVWESNKHKISWIVNLEKPQEARYIKIELDKKEYFHLSGLKIYGK